MKRILNKETVINQKTMKNTNSKGLIPIIVIAFVAVIALAMVGVGIYFKIQNDKQTKENANTNQSVANTNTVTNLNNETNANTNQVAINTNATSNTNATNQNANTNMATDETAWWKWKTYTNEEYNYVVMYPENWQGSGTNENFYLAPLNASAQDTVGISVVSSNPKMLSFTDWAKESGLPEQDKWQSITIPAGEAFQNSLTKTIKILRGVDVYSIDNGIGFERGKTDENIFNRIIDSFQFTDETGEWKTYTSDKYKYSVQYPVTYYAHTDKKADSADCFSATQGDSDAPSFCIWVYDRPQGTSVQEWWESNKQAQYVIDDLKTIEGVETVVHKTQPGSFGGRYFIFATDTKVVKIYNASPYENEIFSTFQFTK